MELLFESIIDRELEKCGFSDVRKYVDVKYYPDTCFYTLTNFEEENIQKRQIIGAFIKVWHFPDHHEATIFIPETIFYRKDPEALVNTVRHELAHYIDYVIRNKSDHSKEFYALFKELFGTNDLGFGGPEDFTIKLARFVTLDVGDQIGNEVLVPLDIAMEQADYSFNKKDR